MIPVRNPSQARRWLPACLAATLLLAASFSPAARAEPTVPVVAGELDPAFGGYGEAGRLFTPLLTTAAFRDAVQLPDGSVIAVGLAGEDLLIVKYTPSGEPDLGFGNATGWTAVNLSGSADVANAVALAPDGKILVAGSAGTGTAADFGVVRLNPNGSLDTPFGSGGSLNIDFNGNRDVAEDIAVTDEGDIFVVGTARTGGTFCPPACDDNIGIARLEAADGAPDSVFGTGGKVQTNLAGNESGLAVAAGNCGIYAAGARAADLNTQPRFVIASYYATGDLVAGFGISGVVTGTDMTRIVDMTCFADGGLLALGDDASDVGLLALTNTGAPVSGFGTSGFARLDFGGVDVAGLVEVLPDRTTLVGGNSGPQLAEVRVSGQGSVVTGTLTLTDPAEVGGSALRPLAFALVADVRYRAVTSVETDAGGHLAFTQRFLDGSLDDGGWQAFDYYDQSDEAAAGAFQPDGKLLVAGSTWPTGGDRVGLLARFTVDGELDEQFAVGGMIVQGGTHRIEEFSDGVKGILVEPDDHIVVFGTDFELVRLSETGQRDGSFGAQGYASANWPDAQAGAIARQSDGKFIVAGYRRPAGQTATFAVARFTAEGELDGTFGTGGTLATGVGPFSAGTDVAIQPDGKFVVAGVTTTDLDEPLTYNFALARYLANGNVDNSFGTSGRVTTDFGSGEVAMSIVALPDGKLLAGGYSLGQGMALARYLPTGALDPSFGVGGKVLLQLTGNEVIYDLVRAGANLVAAVCDASARSYQVVRLTSDGAFDSSFNGNGRAPFNFPGAGCQPAIAIAVAPGRIAAVGTAHAGFGSLSGYMTNDFAIAMYLDDPYLNVLQKLYLPLVSGGP